MLCAFEGVKPLKDVSFHLKKSKIFFSKRFFSFKIKVSSIKIEYSKNWVIELFHEFAHQVMIVENKDSLHSKAFSEYYEYLLETYFDKFVETIFKALYVRKED